MLPFEAMSFTDAALQQADCVLILTDHSCIDYGRVTQVASLIVDTRNAIKGAARLESRARIVRL
jgi:UDP-N-acetyl-D-glucosamine dehydrogenase